jgi:glycine C-acetyltransferase
MRRDFHNNLENEINTLKQKGTYKNYKYNTSALNGKINVEDFGEQIVLCSNNYIGLAGNPEIIKAAHESLDQYGAGASSVRLICGT